jgi:hypothetical protein
MVKTNKICNSILERRELHEKGKSQSDVKREHGRVFVPGRVCRGV